MRSDDPRATLAGIRERSAAALEFPMSGFAEDSIRCCTQSAMDVPLLLGAVERLLELAGEWDADAAELDRDAASARKSPYAGDHAQGRTDEALAGELRDCSGALREAITSALAELEDPAGKFDRAHVAKVTRMGTFSRYVEWCPVPEGDGDGDRS